MTARRIDVDGTELAVHIRGRGPIALLVHGYPLDHRMWLEALHGPLAERRTLVAVDLRGHGGSPWAGDSVHAMERFADDLVAVAKTLADEPVDVVGLSMGGYAALAMYATHSEWIRSLTLCDTKATADAEAAKAARVAAIDTVLSQGRRAIALAMTDKLLAASADASLRARIHTMIEDTPVETIVADLRGLAARPDRTDLLPRIGVPTLVVVGEQDSITPIEDARVMSTAIPGARLAVLPNCGHMAPMERPQDFADELLRHWPA
jgi:pimeloyl-ACP methyl ester carboxylesterase